MSPTHRPSPPVSKALTEAQQELDQLIDVLLLNTGKLPQGTGESLSPTYVILSNKGALVQSFGRAGFRALAEDLEALAQAVEAHAGMRSVVVYVDDRASLAPHGLRPIDPTNPWHVKTLIDSLEARLQGNGWEIRYLLIVGGDGVIPFHRLPNPLDDQDADVPSDNPYASRDTNYLVPERAVGRMPDGVGEGVNLLRNMVRRAIVAHRRGAVASKGLLRAFLAGFRRGSGEGGGRDGLGYSASIWRKASRHVFRPIGEDRQLRISPPLTYEDFRVDGCPRFGYFNLHGVEDGANWYGQRDNLFPADYPLFPVALRPEDVNPDEHVDSVIFSEACYGANVVGKNSNSALALRFLAAGALTFVGSTKVAYGAIAPPIVGADLLSRYFWEGLLAHLTVGEALKRAKVQLAHEMQERQGYLDGEDQKTLTSFVLYGDPSLPVLPPRTLSNGGGGSARALTPTLICQKAKAEKGLLSEEVVAGVKSLVESNLPHMNDAHLRAARVQVCTGACAVGGCLHEGTGACASRWRAKGEAKRVLGVPRRWSLTLEKAIPIDEGAHRQIVKVTVDEGGQVLKMAVSK